MFLDVKGKFLQKNIDFQGPSDFLKIKTLPKFANFLELNLYKYCQSIAMCPFSIIAKKWKSLHLIPHHRRLLARFWIFCPVTSSNLFRPFRQIFLMSTKFHLIKRVSKINAICLDWQYHACETTVQNDNASCADCFVRASDALISSVLIV